MQKDAIKQIQETANIPAIIEQVKVCETPLAVVPDSMGVQSLEKFMPNASRYRLGFKTSSITDFIQYNTKFDQDGATCFVTAESMLAKTIFDLGTVDKPLHQENTAKLQLVKTVAFRNMIQYSDEKISQKSAAEFIEDWSDNIKAFGKDGEEMSNKLASAALRDLTIEFAREQNSKVSDFGESMSALERIEAKNQDSLPATFEFKCIPYQGLQERTLKIRVGILTGSDTPRLVFRVLQLEALSEEIAEEFKDNLNEAFKNLNLETYIGEA